MIPGKTEVALIQVRQGDKADLRQLEEGQFGYALDTGELYIGAPNEGRLAGREFRNLKLLTELNGVSSATVTLVDVILQSGTNNGTMKLIRSYTNGEDVTVDNIPVKNVLTIDNIPDFVSVNDIFNSVIPAGDTTSNKIPSLNSVNLTLDNRLQYYIRNDKKTSNLIPVGTTDGENVTTPIAVDRTIADRLLNYITITKVPEVLTNISLTTSPDNAVISYIKTNTATGGGTPTNPLIFNSASASSAGLVTAADYQKIQEYDTRISRLENGGVWRGSFENMSDLPGLNTSSSLSGGYADINDFVTVINGVDPRGETGQAVFRLRNYDTSTGVIPIERFNISQTVGSSLSDLAVDPTTFKYRTGVDTDTDFVYTYTTDYDYVFDGFAIDPDTSATLDGVGYAVGDIVEYQIENTEDKIRMEVTGVNSGKITSLTFLTPTAYRPIDENFCVLSDVSTQTAHAYPDDGQHALGAVVKIKTTTGSNNVWIDSEYRPVDLTLLGVSYTGTPVIDDEITVEYTASGWGFDYWVSMNIGIATEHKTGVVLSSNDINKVSVGLDGTMTVNSYTDHEQRITANATAIAERVSIAQGALNEGKILVVNSSGDLVLSSGKLSDGIWDYTNNEFITQPSPIDDWNDLPSGIYNLSTDLNTLHSVPNDTGGDYHVTTTAYNNKKIQIAVDMSNPLKQYTRSYDGTSWSSWNYPYASWVPGNN